jgi:hypothetical protein
MLYKRILSRNKLELFLIKAIDIHFLDISTRIKQAIFRLARHLPAIQRQIAKSRVDALKSVHDGMAKSVKGHEFAKALPEKGLSKVNY